MKRKETKKERDKEVEKLIEGSLPTIPKHQYKSVLKIKKQTKKSYRIELNCGCNILMRTDLPATHYGHYNPDRIKVGAIKSCLFCSIKKL